MASIRTPGSPPAAAGAARNGRAIPQGAESFDRKRARVRVGVLGERHERAERPLVLEALQRERDRPPADARLTRRVEHDRGQHVVGLQSNQRFDAKPERRRRRVEPRLVSIRRQLRQDSRPDNCARAPPIGAAAAGSPRRPSASAALPCTSGDWSPSAMTSGSRALLSPIRPSANAAICRTSGSASFSSATSSGTPSRSPTRPTASAARRLTRASPSDSKRPRSGVGGGGTTTGAFPRSRDRRGGSDDRRHVAEHSLILQPEDPRHLLFKGRGNRRRRSRRRARARNRAVHQREHDEKTTPHGHGEHRRDDIIGPPCSSATSRSKDRLAPARPRWPSGSARAWTPRSCWRKRRTRFSPTSTPTGPAPRSRRSSSICSTGTGSRPRCGRPTCSARRRSATTCSTRTRSSRTSTSTTTSCSSTSGCTSCSRATSRRPIS